MDEQIARIYWAYERELDAASALDFDDLLLRAVTLFREADSVREYYQDRFLHLFVDEYQDTNKAQYELVKILGAKHRNVTVVGDDDQSVYGFRGADVRNILSFEHDFPDAKTVTLEQNYRSTQPILDIAHSVIRNNSERAAKRLWTEQSIGEPVRLISVYDEREEALAVGSEIENLIGREGVTLAECAVLYRTNAQSRAFEEVFLRRGIPYQLVGGLRFYDRKEVKDVLDRADVVHIHDEWTKKKFSEGKYKSSEIYGSPSDPRLQQEYQEYLKKRLEEIRKERESK